MGNWALKSTQVRVLNSRGKPPHTCPRVVRVNFYRRCRRNWFQRKGLRVLMELCHLLSFFNQAVAYTIYNIHKEVAS